MPAAPNSARPGSSAPLETSPGECLSVLLDDPSYAEPVRAAFFEDDEGAAYLVWNRWDR